MLSQKKKTGRKKRRKKIPHKKVEKRKGVER